MPALYPNIKRTLRDAYNKILGPLRGHGVAPSSIAPALPDPYCETATLVASNVGGLRYKRVLEVGCDNDGSLVSLLAQQHGALEAIGINPRLPFRALLPNCRVEPIDIRRTPYPDGYFDCVVSVSAFEHIHNLDRALEESYRILKPGGFLYSNFGPIYSTSFGHHLWLTIGDRTYNYHNTVLPPFCHLLMTADELLEHCNTFSEREVSSRIVEYVFSSKDQNRLFYDDYIRIVEDSEFIPVYVIGLNCPEMDARYLPPDLPATLSRLRKKYPGMSNFLYDGIVMLLRKP
jgi:SAM-dependent methyltransferase